MKCGERQDLQEGGEGGWGSGYWCERRYSAAIIQKAAAKAAISLWFMSPSSSLSLSHSLLLSQSLNPSEPN